MISGNFTNYKENKLLLEFLFIHLIAKFFRIGTYRIGLRLKFYMTVVIAYKQCEVVVKNVWPDCFTIVADQTYFKRPICQILATANVVVIIWQMRRMYSQLGCTVLQIVFPVDSPYPLNLCLWACTTALWWCCQIVVPMNLPEHANGKICTIIKRIRKNPKS